jgi:hypothetical protein
MMSDGREEREERAARMEQAKKENRQDRFNDQINDRIDYDDLEPERVDS